MRRPQTPNCRHPTDERYGVRGQSFSDSWIYTVGLPEKPQTRGGEGLTRGGAGARAWQRRDPPRSSMGAQFVISAPQGRAEKTLSSSLAFCTRTNHLLDLPQALGETLRIFSQSL